MNPAPARRRLRRIRHGLSPFGLHAIVRVTSACGLEVGMGYLIRMAPEVGVWLANVRDRDPAASDRIDEAVAALRARGESVGPPLVVPVGDPPLNARPDLDAAYGRQLERLTRVRRAVADAGP